jgi:hypothetical protein
LQEVQKERSVILPEIMRQIMKEEEVRELEWAVENEGVQMKVVWAGERQRQAQTPPAPKFIEEARGEELIGGTVREKGKKGYVAGKVIGFEGREYDIRLCNGKQVKWAEEEVRDRWIVDQYIMRRGWTAQDQRTLQAGVRGVVAKTMKTVKQRHVTLFPSKIDEREWEATETYTCTMKTSEIGQVRALLMEVSDSQAADLLVIQGTVF